jgi:hypothetical protein
MSAVMLFAGWASSVIATMTAIHFCVKARESNAHIARLTRQRDDAAALAAVCALMPGFGDGLREGYVDVAVASIGQCTASTIAEWSDRAAHDNGLLDALCARTIDTARLMTEGEKNTWAVSGVIRAMQDRVSAIGAHSTG